VVYAATGRTSTMLMITACSLPGFNGNCGIYTMLVVCGEFLSCFTNRPIVQVLRRLPG
jgi:hypothetical protein